MVHSFTFHQLQVEVREWSTRNFGVNPALWKFLGIVEEVGELAHAELKMLQGIRTNEDHEAKGKDAVGDMLVYLADFCSRRGWDLQEIIEQVWHRVSQRDWKKDPVRGGEGTSSRPYVVAEGDPVKEIPLAEDGTMP